MNKVVCYICLALLLLTTGAMRICAEEQLPPKLQKLTDEAYRCYSARETDNYFEAVKRVKDATEFSEFQETYYRACSYEAIYMFEFVDRKKGVELSHAIYNHAKENNSNVGMYFATFTLGSIREMSGNNDMAEKSFLQALELKEKYLPEESAAPCYLGLCEIALRKKKYDEAYRERAQLIAEHGGQGGLFGELINVYQAKNRKQWQLALNFCVGDVSGKGVPAALFMAEVTRMFRTLVDGKLPPNTIATRLNHALTEDNEQSIKMK